MEKIFVILLGTILVNNYIFSRFLGICPFLGVSKRIETATGMGLAVIFVMALASLCTYLVQHLILIPLKLEFLQTLAFIVIIAALVQFVEIVILKYSPTLYRALGVYLPLITTNCAVLGVAILNVEENYSLLESVVNGIGGGTGFLLAIVLFAGVRERLETSNIPQCFKGVPIALVTAGLISMAFFGFQGLIK